MAKKKSEDMKDALLNRAGSKSNRDTVFISTGSTISDLTLGCGNGLGIETGSLINIAGRSGGGKSQLVMSIMACANRDYNSRLQKKLLDSENGSNFDTEAVYGFSLSDKEIATCRTVEEAHSDINVFLDELTGDHIGIYAVDSIDGLLGSETDDAIEERTNAYSRGKEYDQKTYGMGKPKYLSTTMLPDLANKFINKNTIGIVTSQVRDNPTGGMYGPKDIISNGRALLFYSHLQVWLKKRQPIMSNGFEIGSVVEYTVKKGRGAKAFRNCLVTIYYTMGIDGISTDVDYLYDFRSDKTGELLARASKPVLWQGEEFADRDAIIAHIDNNDLLSELRDAVVAKWDALDEKALAPIAERKNRYINNAS